MRENKDFIEVILSELDAIVLDENATTTDADITNIFYLGELPESKHAGDADLEALRLAVTDWMAWETTRCEQAVQTQINGGALPKDASFTSRNKRTAYRAKVLTVLRNQSAWLKNIDTGDTKKLVVSTTKPVNLAIVDTLINAKPVAANLPYRNFLKAVGAAYSSDTTAIQPCYHTLIGYQYDDLLGTFQAVVLVVTFVVNMKGVKSAEGIQAADPITIDFTSIPYSFSLEDWNEVKPDRETTAVGRKLNLQKSLNLVAFPADE